MLTSAQIDHLRFFVCDYLERTAAASQQEWLRRFPKAAEYRWQHTLNVLRNAEAILEGEQATQEQAEVVRVAVYLHDVSMFVCDHEVHGEVSAQIAEQYLSEQGYPPDFIPRVRRAIAEHGTDLGDVPPKEQGAHFSWEGKVLLEADILDKLGASAITGALLGLGSQGLLTHEAPTALANGLAMERAMIFKDYLWTETGRRMGARRFTFFLQFMERLKEEIELVDVPAARE